MTITNFFLGIAVVVLGVMMVRFNSSITHLFPKTPKLEYYLGGSASFAVFYLVAFGVILFGMLLAVGLHDEVLDTLLGPLFG